MFPRGLNKGDTWKDGGRLFEIDHINEDGTYLAHVIEEEKCNTVQDFKEKMRAEIKEELRAEILAELEPVAEEPIEEKEEVYKCQYCGREITSKVGLVAHEKACSKKKEEQI